MQAFHIATFTDGKYRPLASSNHVCVITPYEGQIIGLTPGDHVIMHHARTKDSTEGALATEILQVHAVAAASFDQIIKAHWNNHHMNTTRARLIEHLNEAHDNPDGKAMFMAVYF